MVAHHTNAEGYVPQVVESASHLQRMHCHCAAIAERMGFDGELIGGASRLHDRFRYEKDASKGWVIERLAP